MNTSVFSKMLTASSILLASAGALLLPSSAHADDVSAYINPPENVPGPNLLFILDESGSMNFGTPSRWSQLEDAMKEILVTSDMTKNAKVSALTFASPFRNVAITPLKSFDVGDDHRNTLYERIDNVGPSGGTPYGSAIYHGTRWAIDGWPTSEIIAGESRSSNELSNTSPMLDPKDDDRACVDNRIIYLTDGDPNIDIPGGTEVSLNNGDFTINRPSEQSYWDDIYKPLVDSTTTTLTAPGGNNALTNIIAVEDQIRGDAALEEIVNEMATEKGYCAPFKLPLSYLHNPPRSGDNRLRRPTICIAEIMDYLSGKDLVTTGDFKDHYTNISLDTVGFNIPDGDAEQILTEMAEYGRGDFYQASTSDDLINSFRSSIRNATVSVDVSYNAPSIPIDLNSAGAFNDQLYIPLLRPSATRFWGGNLKNFSYEVDDQNKIQLKVNDKTLLPPVTGQENDQWSKSSITGGKSVLNAGVSAKLNANTKRRIFTHVSSGRGMKPLSKGTKLDAVVSNVFDVSLASENVFCGAQNCAGNLESAYTKFLIDNNPSTDLYIDYKAITGGDRDDDQKITGITLSVPKNIAPIKSEKLEIIPSTRFNASDLLSEVDIDVTWELNDGSTLVQEIIADVSNGNTYSQDIKMAHVANDLNVNINDIEGLRKIDLSCNGCSKGQFPLADINVYERIGKHDYKVPNSNTSVSDIEWFISTDVTNHTVNISTEEEPIVMPVTKMGAPIHTKPIHANYDVDDDTDDVIFLPTSEGVLHAFDAKTGEELWGFMPTELLGNLKLVRHNAQIGLDQAPIYGLDSTPYYFEYNATNGKIKRMLVFGMRRGGQSYYALDVTNRNKPFMEWKITPETEGFSKLGQTWAAPYPAPISIDGQNKKALIFGGGYDANTDNYSRNSDQGDHVGNRIYFVDVETGKLLIGITDEKNDSEFSSASTNNEDPYIVEVPGLKYGIAAEPIHIDYDSDDNYDRFYFADTGGQIIRVDMDDFSSDPVNAGILAKLQDDDKYIRFFSRPSVAKVYKNQNDQVAIAIGSGNRPNVIDKTTIDRMYMVRDSDTYLSQMQEDNPTITVTALYDATSNVIGDPASSANAVQDAINTLAAKNGWFIDLAQGEKVINSARIFDSTIYFNTYKTVLPKDQVVTCKPSGTSNAINRFYALDLIDATGGLDQQKRVTTVSEGKGTFLPPEISFYVNQSPINQDGSINLLFNSVIDGGPLIGPNDDTSTVTFGAGVKLQGISWEELHD